MLVKCWQAVVNISIGQKLHKLIYQYLMKTLLMAVNNEWFNTTAKLFGVLFSLDSE